MQIFRKRQLFIFLVFEVIFISAGFGNFLEIHYSFFCGAGEDGRDFVTVEHCGDDFLAALADSIQDKEDWDDLQAIESEACGALNDIFVNTIPNNEEAGNAIVFETRDLGKRNSLRDPDHENIERFCSLSSEDSDLEVISQNDIKHDPSFCFDKNEDYTIQQPSKSTVSYACFLQFIFCKIFLSFCSLVLLSLFTRLELYIWMSKK